MQQQLKSIMAMGFLGLLTACGGGDNNQATPASSLPYKASAVVDWNNIALQAVRDTAMGPPPTARAMAILHTATFDAWAAFDAKAVPVMNAAPAKSASSERTEQNKTTAVSFAAYAVLNNLFPSRAADFDNKLKAQGYVLPAQTAPLAGSPADIGLKAAAAVLSFRSSDGANQANAYADTSGYQSINTTAALNDPNQWQPLTFCNGKSPGFLVPHWQNVVPFALPTANAVRPTKLPAKYGSPEYLAQAKAILDISANLSEREKVIAEYWADGPSSETPPGHWQLFAQYVAARDKLNLDQEAKLFLALGNAVLDASIATWEAKRYYNYVRPISAIRHLYKGQQVNAWAGPNLGTKTVAGETWMPYQACTFITPPFAEYTSGHSAFSAAAAEVLSQFTGSPALNWSYTAAAGSNKFEQNVPAVSVTLNWSTFQEAADQAGFSRRYGGIHFEDGDMEGRALGKKVGQLVMNKARMHWGD
ncbi:MAG: hypothetical protein RLZZ502_22 [Pseudomonadota bacterium]|jgi:hypothetical protein